MCYYSGLKYKQNRVLKVVLFFCSCTYFLLIFETGRVIIICVVYMRAVFEYENDSVLTVEEMDYINCDASNPITEFTNGKSTLNLDRSGAFYFISGTDDHCIKGQKLLVEVMAPHQVPKSPPPETSIAPEGFSPMLAPSPSYDSDGTIDAVSSSSMLLSSTFIVSHLVTFVIVMLLH